MFYIYIKISFTTYLLMFKYVEPNMYVRMTTQKFVQRLLIVEHK